MHRLRNHLEHTTRGNCSRPDKAQCVRDVLCSARVNGMLTCSLFNGGPCIMVDMNGLWEALLKDESMEVEGQRWRTVTPPRQIEL